MREKLLKTLAVAAFGMITFPFMLTNDALSFQNISVLRILVFYAMFGAVFACGYGLGKVTLRHKKLLLPCRILGFGSFFLSFFLLFFTDQIAVTAAAGISAVFWFFLGERASRKHYADFFPLFMLGVYIAVTLLCYFFFGAMAPEELRAPVQSAVICAFMAELCLAALLINQSGIHDKASRRRETKTMLPKGLSGYNAALVLIITLAGLGLYLFSDHIIWLLRELLRQAISLILWLMQIFSEPMETQSGEPSEIRLWAQQAQSGWTPVYYALAILLLILFRRQIWNALKNAARRIYAFFVREPEKTGEEPDFVDYLEQTEPRRRTKTDGISDAQLLRRYRAEAVSARKFRLGYRILLRGMERGGAGIVPSDTAAQQCAKGRKVFGEELEEIAACYNSVRYHGEQPAAEKLALLDETLPK